MADTKDRLLHSNNTIIRGLSNGLYGLFLKYINSPRRFKRAYAYKMSDIKYIKKMYKERFGKELNLDNPRSFNEKANWRKLYDRNPNYTMMVDKYRLKGIVDSKCGPGHVIPLLGVWDNPKSINIQDLPERFVLKANHAGGVIVCRDKNSFDVKKAKKELCDALKKDYYLVSREWPYKNVKRKVLCEEYIGENLTDYKNYCFNGKVKYTFVWENVSREDGRKPDPFFCGAYDRNWEKTGIDIDYPQKDKIIEKPAVYDEMVRIAEKLSENIPFVRVDCFVKDNTVYVGEMTFFPWGGFQKFNDEYWDNYLGEQVKLPAIHV